MPVQHFIAQQSNQQHLGQLDMSYQQQQQQQTKLKCTSVENYLRSALGKSSFFN